MTDLNNSQQKSLALSGIVQAAYLVKQLAWKGTIDEYDLETCVNSIFNTDPNNIIDVYGKLRNVRTGFEQTIKLLDNAKTPKDQEIARYTISLMHLERLLMKDANMQKQILRGIERARIQATHFNTTHENVIANLAGVYTDTLSTYKFRIHVAGDTNSLNNSQTINKIRTCLLAGVRSSVLWRQLGGSRWQLVFGKKLIINDCKQLQTLSRQHEFAS